MGISRLLVATSTTLATASLTNATETAVVTSPPLSPGVDGNAFLILASFDCTIGTAGVSVLLKLRRGATAAGTTIYTGLALTAVAADLRQFFAMMVDTPGIIAGQQWTLTGTVASASAVSTINAACIAVFAL